MFTERMIDCFQTAARALSLGLKDSGYTGNGLRKLDFVVEGKTYTAIQQNPDKHSVPAQLAKQGHEVFQIKDDAAGVLLGNVDLTTEKWNDYGPTPKAIPIEEITKVVESAAVPAGR